MSTDYEQDDVSAFFDHGADSATFDQATDSVGLPDDPSVDQPLPNHIADQVDDYDRHQVEKDLEPEEPTEEDYDRHGKSDRKVPYGALHEERTKRQEAQDRARVLEQQLALQQQQLAQFQQYQQQVALAQQQEAEPDPEEDPIAFIRFKEKQLSQQLQNMQQQREYEQAAVQVQHRSQELGQFVTQAQTAFEAENPEYREAYALVHDTAAATLRQQYPGATDQQIQAAQAVAVFQFLDGCQRTGQNPCELVFQKAQALGFTPGQRVPSARLPKQAPTSLSTLPASGRAPDQMGRVAARDIAGLSNDEFDRLWNSMKEDGTQRPAV